MPPFAVPISPRAAVKHLPHDIETFFLGDLFLVAALGIFVDHLTPELLRRDIRPHLRDLPPAPVRIERLERQLPPDSLPTVAAHHEKLGDIMPRPTAMWGRLLDQHKAGQPLVDPRNVSLPS